MPSRVSRSPRFSAFVRPFSRIALRALSKSPLASTRAFLASVKPTPDNSLSFLIASMVISAILYSFYLLFCLFDSFNEVAEN